MFFRTRVSILQLLGQPYKIELSAPPRADERLQMIIDNNEGVIGLRGCSCDLIWTLPKIDLQDDYFRSTSQLVTLFYAKEFTLFTQRVIGTTKRETPVRNKKMTVYGSETFLNEGPVNKSTFSSKFRRFVVCRFVVSPFCDRDRRTK